MFPVVCCSAKNKSARSATQEPKEQSSPVLITSCQPQPSDGVTCLACGHCHRGTNTCDRNCRQGRETSASNYGYKGSTTSRPLYDPNQRVLCFKGPGCVFSNMYPCDIVYRGKRFPCSEGAYQWQKAIDLGQDAIAHDIFLCESGFEAKAEAGRLDSYAVEEWRKTKGVEAMRCVQESKYEYVAEFRSTLMESYTSCLVEATQDTFWGAGLLENDALKCEPGCYPGQNNLGILLMKLRDKYFPNITHIEEVTEVSKKRSNSANAVTCTQRTLGANESAKRSHVAGHRNSTEPMRAGDVTLSANEVSRRSHGTGQTNSTEPIRLGDVTLSANEGAKRSHRTRHTNSTEPMTAGEAIKKAHEDIMEKAREVENLREKLKRVRMGTERERHQSGESHTSQRRSRQTVLHGPQIDTHEHNFVSPGNQMVSPGQQYYPIQHYARLVRQHLKKYKACIPLKQI